MQASAVTSSTAGKPEAGRNQSLRDLNLDHFLKLMITELQNQDPLNPLDNHQILQQISQIREIEASNQLRETLDAVLLGQNLGNASGLLDRTIRGLSEKGSDVEGVVSRVTVADGKVKLHVGEHDVKLKNVREVLG